MKGAIIGTGQIAAQHLACLRTLPEAAVVAVCDQSAAAAAAAAERFGVPVSFSRHQEMLAAVHPDVVHVTAPAPTHFPLTRDAL